MNRRSFLGALGSGGLAGVAGCLGTFGFGASESTPTPITNREATGDSNSGTIPQFQGGPAHTGHLDTTAPTDAVSTYWRRTPAQYDHSQPTVVGDRIFVSFAGTLVCLGREEGETRWTADVGHDGASTTAVFDGTAYVTVWNGGQSVDRGLVAVDTEGGAVQWRGLTDEDITTSPAVTAEGVFVGGGYETPTVAAFDHDGTERWRHDLAEYASTPAVANGVVYYGGGDARVVAYDAVSGERRWQAETDGETTATPTVTDDGLVVVGTRAGTLYALDAQDGTTAWTAGLSHPVRASAAVAGDHVVVPTDERLVAVDRTGARRWTADSVTGGTDPVVADDVVYLGDGRTVRALALADGRERWAFETRERNYTDVVLQGVRSAPTVVDGVVFVATQAGDVYALGGS